MNGSTAPQTRIVTEGKVSVLVNGAKHDSGPGSKITGFYNPVMMFNRDVHVSFLRALGMESKRTFLDGLSSTGIRGIRVGLELDEAPRLVLNDINPKSCELINENLERNGMDARVECGNVNALMSREYFDHIDLDPYGTPAPYLDTALQSLKDHGILSVTATDTAALTGSKPRVSWRRYGIKLELLPAMREISLRALLGFIATTAARHEKGIQSLLVHASEHYVRAYVKVRKGAGRADSSLEQLKRFGKNWRCLEEDELGPIWWGPLFNMTVLDKMQNWPWLGTGENLEKHTALWREEAPLPPLYYHSDRVAQEIGGSPPGMEQILASLKERGFQAGRTHFEPKGFKTDAPWKEVADLFKGYQ